VQPLVLHMFLVAGSCRQPKTYVKSETAITVFELVMMGGVSPETCWAIKKHWDDKFYYMVASCWFFLWDLYYDARIHEHHIMVYVNKCFRDSFHLQQQGLNVLN